MNPILLVEPRRHFVVEVHRLVPSTLSASVKVLTGVLGDPDGLLDGVVVIGDVFLEVIGRDVVVVQGDEIRLGPTFGTNVLELQDPFETGGGAGGSGHPDRVTLSLEGAHVLLPERHGALGRDVGLTRVVGLVEKEDVLGRLGPAVLSLVERGDGVLGTPHHGNVFDTQVRAVVRYNYGRVSATTRDNDKDHGPRLTPSCIPGNANRT